MQITVVTVYVYTIIAVANNLAQKKLLVNTKTSSTYPKILGANRNRPKLKTIYSIRAAYAANCGSSPFLLFDA